MATAFALQEIAKLLSKGLLFGALDDDARRELAGHAHRRSFDTGEPIFHVGAPGQSMVVILNGTVRVSLPGPRGKGVILADLPAGELLGEVALLDGKERSADATALTKCELVVLERRDVVAFLEKRPDVCLKIHATRENVNRCLRNWQRQGIVDLDERWIVILQREALGAIAGYS